MAMPDQVKLGDKFRVIEDESYNFDPDEIVCFASPDKNTPFFVSDKEFDPEKPLEHYDQYINLYWENVEPYQEPEPHKSREGGFYLVVGEDLPFPKETIVVMCDDDGELNPWFCKPEYYSPGIGFHNCQEYAQWFPIHLSKLENITADSHNHITSEESDS